MDFSFPETNPQTESLRFGLASPQIWIRKDSRIRILKDSFPAIVLRIHKDSWEQVESLKIDWIRDSRFKTILFKSGFVIHDMNPGFVIQDTNPGFVVRHGWIEPFWSQDS